MAGNWGLDLIIMATLGASMTGGVVDGPPQYPGPRSTFIKSAEILPPRTTIGAGDTWPITQTIGGGIYGSAGDNSGATNSTNASVYKMNVWQLEGAPFTSNWSARATHNQAGVWGIDGCTSTNVKPAGLLAVNDTLYLGVSCVGIGRQSDGQHRQSNIAGGLAVSTDLGKTFAPAPAKFFTGRLGSPQLINRGKGHSAAPDGFVYAHFCYGIDNKSFWDANSHVLVGRAPEHRILERSSWRFYTAAGGWSADDDEATPVMSFADSLSQNQATYSQTLGRYLIANTAYLDPVHRRPVSYRNPSDGSQKGMQLTMFESPTPWGQ